MNSRRSELLILLGLLGAGGGLYALRWVLFPDPALHNEMWRFLVGDVGFLCLQVALVTLILDRLLRNRERQAMLRKLNMVIGAFFSEVGTELLGHLAGTDAALSEVRSDLIPHASWTDVEYAAAARAVVGHRPRIELDEHALETLKTMLVAEKTFLLGLLGNQALLEHERFTELLWAVTHLAEELEARSGFTSLPHADTVHLTGDVKRAYALLTLQWLSYLQHLQTQYPYLFSLAARINPLDPEAQAEVVS